MTLQLPPPESFWGLFSVGSINQSVCTSSVISIPSSRFHSFPCIFIHFHISSIFHFHFHFYFQYTPRSDINQSTIWLYCLQTKNFVCWSTQLHPAQSDLPSQWTHSRWARRPDRNRSGSFVFTFANSVNTRRWSLNDQGIVAVLSMKVCESPVPSTRLT